MRKKRETRIKISNFLTFDTVRGSSGETFKTLQQKVAYFSTLDGFLDYPNQWSHTFSILNFDSLCSPFTLIYNSFIFKYIIVSSCPQQKNI